MTIKTIKNNKGIETLIFAETFEFEAYDQIKKLVNFEAYENAKVRIMPDAHAGKGCTVGTTMTITDKITPNLVGVDIGCGMCALKTSLQTIEKDSLKKIMGLIRDRIPLGMNHHKTPQEEWLSDSEKGNFWGWSIIESEYKSSLYQIGTLGGGNHFIEIQKGSDGFIWIMIHSGSRNLGYKVANHYNKIAIQLNEKWFSQVPKKWELAFLPLEEPSGKEYLLEMQACVKFALLNRIHMIARIKKSILSIIPDTSFEELINIAHNYASIENHFNENVIVHRKGATQAKIGQLGIIPGSQGTSSYIVEGLGNKESFESCSHGAGRRIGRKQAQRELNLEAEKKRLDDQGIIHGIRTVNDLDEAAGAYKDISEVIENQKDLIKIMVELKPLAVIKG